MGRPCLCWQKCKFASLVLVTSGKFAESAVSAEIMQICTICHALITSNGADHFVAVEGYDALGLTRPTAAFAPEVSPLEEDPELEATVTNVEAQWAQAAQQTLAAPKAHRQREHSKQATIIGTLCRPEGATVAQICACTGWQAHTMRGTFAGAFKRKLGLTITSAKPDGRERCYHVAASADEMLA
jgi:hypothetical protein